jgi:hypothetical protein
MSGPGYRSVIGGSRAGRGFFHTFRGATVIGLREEEQFFRRGRPELQPAFRPADAVEQSIWPHRSVGSIESLRTDRTVESIERFIGIDRAIGEAERTVERRIGSRSIVGSVERLVEPGERHVRIE